MELAKLALFFLVVATGCASIGPWSAEKAAPKPLYYTLRAGTAVTNTSPLPSYTPIFVDWHFDRGPVETRLGFKAWDFNSDGRFDMVESLSDSGVSEASFDFDFDGRIDFRKEYHQPKFPRTTGAPSPGGQVRGQAEGPSLRSPQ
jgi:hypothetical protein